MMPRLSICVPTFERPQLVREAIESCFRQRFRPIEILVGDDSHFDATERALASLLPPDGVTLHYVRNAERLGQSGNVGSLIERARGSHLMLLHDDDLLCDGGLDRLIAELDRHPGAVCVYGMQYVAADDGTVDAEFTTRWNQRDKRTASRTGAQPSPLRAALWHQIPNDGFLLDAKAAKRSPMRDESIVGHAVDIDFIIGIAKSAAPGSFVLVPAFVSKYRLTSNSIARSKAINTRADLFLRQILADRDLERESEARDELLARISVGAALDAANAGERIEALRIMGSRYYSAPWLSRWTAYRLMAVATPAMADRIKQLLG